MADEIVAHWVPNRRDPTEHHEGIPARDLTAADWDALTPEQQETVRGSKRYRMVEKPPPSPRPDRGKAPS